jgi:hypothetical protein
MKFPAMVKVQEEGQAPSQRLAQPILWIVRGILG